MRRNDFWGAGFMYFWLPLLSFCAPAADWAALIKQCHILPASYSLLYMLQQENFSPPEFWRAYGL